MSLLHELGLSLSASTLMGMVNNLYREDLFFFDSHIELLSKERSTDDFMLFSERFSKLYPGYMLDSQMLIRPKPHTPTLNLQKALDSLRSTDTEVYLPDVSSDALFLDGSPILADRIGLVSFPRCGNTLVRKYVQKLTGVETGSDNWLHWNVCLQMQGFKGEYISDDSVFCIKSHFPWAMPPSVKVNKMVVVVRNPLDAIISYVSLISTSCHSKRLSARVDQMYPSWWNQIVNLVT